jgi:glucose-6-phosphate isomerase
MNDAPYIDPIGIDVENISEFKALSHEVIIRKEKDMLGFFQDAKDSDKPIYEVYVRDGPHTTDMAITVMKPGKVGEEFHMTKGHYHERAEADETYYSLQGKGIILMQTIEGQEQTIEFSKGSAVYVPPGWAHRTINIGREELIILAIYPKDAGHDYGAIKDKGFKSLVVEKDGEVKIVQNPNY